MEAAWLKEELGKPGRSQSALARWLKIDPSSVNRMAAGARKISAAEANGIREYMRVTGKGLSDEPGHPSNENRSWSQRLTGGDAPVLQLLPIRFRAQAGTWMDVDVYATQDYGEGPIPGDPRIAPQNQWLEEVVGESVDLIIKPGSLIHVIDAIALEYSPRHDDMVVIERIRFQGREIERSVKQVAMTPAGVEFWGRSTNSRWNVAIGLNDGLDGDETAEVRIAGWVRHAIQRL